jgi:hypothetical protein
MTSLLLLAACATDGDPVAVRVPEDTAAAEVEAEEAVVAALVPLDGPRLLRRVSLDLRGVLPTVAELDAAEADPDHWRELAVTWLADPRFEDRLVQLLAERWWTRVDVFDIVYQDYDLDGTQEYRFERAVGEEPLRLIARVVSEDAPWSTVVTADWTMATAVTGGLWPVDYPAGERGWRPVRYTDGRPAAGVLSTNGLWWRYSTTQSNMNRGRAAAISRLLLCEDPLDRAITLSQSGDSVVVPEDALRTDPYCLSCHASLDPLAASLFGFWWVSMYSRVEEHSYHPERESLAEAWLGATPAWFGAPIAGLTDLGAAVASDSRFYTCAAETFASLYWRRPIEPADLDTVQALRAVLLDADARPQALLLAVLETPEYQAGAVTDDADGSAEAREQTARLLGPGQLSASLFDVTGRTWTQGGEDLLDSDARGFRVLAGGVDGLSVTEPQRRPSLPWSLVVERYAWLAADRMVADALDEGHGHPMLPDLTLAHRPGDPEWEAALARTWWRMTATRLSTEDRDALADLFDAATAESGPADAWRVVLSVIFRDPLTVSY